MFNYSLLLLQTIITLHFLSDVPILHLIPYPFPIFWHKPGDNRSNIDMKTTENINRILRAFIASYLHINV